MDCAVWPSILPSEHYLCNNMSKFMMDDELYESIALSGR